MCNLPALQDFEVAIISRAIALEYRECLIRLRYESFYDCKIILCHALILGC